MRRSLPCFAAALAAACCCGTMPAMAEEAFCGAVEVYQTAGARRSGILNVHLVPHTHDDAGWQKTIEGYYFGSDQHIQMAGVQYELDTVMASLEADPAKTFVYSDIGFFSMWWGEAAPSVRARMRALVAQGRLSFVNGGWVQHCEATPGYELMVDQLTRGHRWINATFGPGALPTVSWAIDPFGHSATHAALAGAAGYDAVYFARTDFADVERRAARGELEVVWRGEPSYGASADIFAGKFPHQNYSTPWGFSFDWAQADPPIIDNTCAAPGVNNVRERVDAFVAAVRDLAKPVRMGGDGGDVMLTMGADFQYAAAPIYFKNMDKLIHHVNADGRVNVFYSTPARYTAAKHATVPAWPLKTDDHMPLIDAPDAVWSGFFTSRPGLKRAIARAGADLAAYRQLAVLEGLQEGDGASAAAAAAAGPAWSAALDALESAVAFGAHHDTITGTSKQHATNSYLARLARAGAGVEALAGKVLAARAGVKVPAGAAVEWCRSLNASVCAPTARASAAGRPFTVVLYNSLAAPRTEGVRLPIHPGDGGGAWAVTGPGGEAVPSQILPVSTGGRTAAASLVAAGGAAAADAPDHEIAFVAALPPLGAAAFTVAPVQPRSRGAASASTPVGEGWTAAARARTRAGSVAGLARPDALLTLAPTGEGGGRGSASLAVDAATGALVGIAPGARDADAAADAADAGTSSPPPGTVTGFAIEMGYYKAADDNARGIAGGAYIMRTDASPFYTGFDLDSPPPPAVPARAAETGPVVATYTLEFSPYASATVRVWKGIPEPEVEWTAGPLPSADRVGREVIISYTAAGLGGTGNGTLWTDSNGRRNMKRVRNDRPTFVPATTQEVAGNFYPVTSAATLDGDGGLALTAVTDRAQGAASRGDGSLDFLVHRRLFKDDWKGVAEPLNETECGCVPEVSTASIVGYSACACGGVVASGTHTLVVAPVGAAGARARRDAQARAGRPLLVGVIDAELPSAPPAARSAAPSGAAASPLPPNVRLVTLAPAGRPGAEDGRILLRLAHAYEVGEHPALSQPATVDLNALLDGVAWSEVTEVTLTAGRALGGAPKRLAWQVDESLDLDLGDARAKAAAAAVRPGAGLAVPAAPLACAAGCAARPLPVSLGPMQIRTFLVTPPPPPTPPKR